MPIAIPGLAVAIVAILGLLICLGVKQFGAAMAAMIPSDVPVVKYLHGLFAGIAAAGAYVAAWLMADVIRPVVNVILGPIVSLVDWFANMARAFDAVTSEVVWLVSHGIPQLASSVRNLARSLYHSATAYALRLYHSATAYAAKIVAAARTYALGLYHSATAYAAKIVAAARTYALGLYHSATAYAAKIVAAARTYALGLYNAEHAAMLTQIAGVQASIRGLTTANGRLIDSAVAKALDTARSVALADATRLIHVVDVDVAGVFAVEWPAIIDEVTELEGVIATDLPDIAAAVRAIPRAVPTDLVTSIAAVGSVALPLIRYLRQCGVPNCRNLSKYGRDLQDLLHATAALGLFTFFAEMVTDPEGTAHAVSDVLGPIARAAGDEARDLIGV